MQQMEIYYESGEVEKIKDIDTFDLISDLMIIKLADGKNRLIRKCQLMKGYELKEQPITNPNKAKKVK